MERINLHEYRKQLIESLTELVKDCGGRVEFYNADDVSVESYLDCDAEQELPQVKVCDCYQEEYTREISVYGLTTEGSNWRDSLWLVWYEDGYICEDELNLEDIDSVVSLESIDYLYELVENRIKESAK